MAPVEEGDVGIWDNHVSISILLARSRERRAHNEAFS